MRESPSSRSRVRSLWMIAVIQAMAFTFAVLILLRTAGTTLSSIEAMDTAQIARNLARGRGFTTLFIRPVSLLYVSAMPSCPELSHAPLHPVLLSFFFRWAGACDEIVILFSVLWFLLTLPVVYLFARHVFGEKAGIAALLLTAFNPVLMREAFTGTCTPMAGFFVLLLAIVLHFRSATVSGAGAGGILAGLLFLTQPAYGLLALPSLLVLIAERAPRRLLRASSFCAALLATASPWLIRNGLVAGNPLFSLSWFDPIRFTGALPGNIFFRAYQNQLLWSNLSAYFVLKKLFQGVVAHLRCVFVLPGTFLMAFFLVAPFLPTRDKRIIKSIVLLFGSILLLVPVFALWNLGPTGWAPLIPCITVIASSALVLALSRFAPGRPWTAAAAWVFALILLLAPGIRILLSHPEEPGPVVHRNNIRRISELLSPGQAIATDSPWATAWYGEIPSLWLPLQQDDLVIIASGLLPVNALYLTPALIRYPGKTEFTRDWVDLYSGRGSPEGFGFGTTFFLPQDDVLFLNRADFPEARLKRFEQDLVPGGEAIRDGRPLLPNIPAPPASTAEGHPKGL